MTEEFLGHSSAFRRRRFLNWFPLGLTYAMLYMGRYNLTVSKNALGDLMTKSDFGLIFAVGSAVYAFSFLINGPLVDRIGGKKGILIGVLGSALANLGMGVYLHYLLGLENPKEAPLGLVFSILYGVNMYFQSYGAVSIVKVNASWFHVRERGSFSGIFGAMIASGIYFAFDGNEAILRTSLVVGQGVNGGDATWWVFYAPAMFLLGFFALESFLLKDRPSQAGLEDFDTQDASSGEDLEERIPPLELYKRILTHPVILTLIFIEFCTGVIRNGVMHWFSIYANEQIRAGIGDLSGWQFMHDHWGFMLMVAGITGGLFAGFVSDKLFQSRRAPVAGILYGLMLVSILGMTVMLKSGWGLGAIVFFISVGVIGTHGLLSGTATMDFGGRKGAATTVGVIDGFVYLGSAVQSISLGYLTEKSWSYWPWFLLPFSVIGLVLLTRIWNAKPGKSSGH